MLDLLSWIGLFTAGYLLIYFAADIFIENLKEICTIYKVSPFIIGLVVLGIDPEESIASIVAALNGLPYIAVGNVIGNSIFSLTLCFALPAFFHEIDTKSISQGYFLIIYSCMVIILTSFFFFQGLFYCGLIAVAIYFIYLFRNIKHAKKEVSLEVVYLEGGGKEEVMEEMEKSLKIRKIIMVITSFSLIFLGGELLVFSAEQLIHLTGIPEAFFGFIIIAFVTNVEELTLVFKSIKKKSIEIGLGGMIGKVIWNLSFTFGISAIIAINIEFDWILVWNWLILLAAIVYFNIISIKKTLDKRDGIVLISLLTIFITINLLAI